MVWVWAPSSQLFIVYFLKIHFIQHNFRFYNVWIYPPSHSATKKIRAPCYHEFYFYFPSPLLAYSLLASPARLLLTLPVSIPAAGTLTQLIPYLHTFTAVSLLLALMADPCLPLCAGEDTFKLHSVQLELWGHGEADPRAAWETGPAEGAGKYAARC